MSNLDLLAYAAEWVQKREEKSMMDQNNNVLAIDNDDDYEFAFMNYLSDLGNQIKPLSSDHDTVSCVPIKTHKLYVSDVLTLIVPRRKRSMKPKIPILEVEKKKELNRSASEINPSLDYSMQGKLKRRKLAKNESKSSDDHPFLLPLPLFSPVPLRIIPPPNPQKTPKKTTHKKVTYSVPTTLPDLRSEYKEIIQRMGGTDLHLVIQKELTDTDVSGVHCRLSIPVSQMTYDITKWLTEKERSDMGTKVKGKWYSLVVPLIDKDLDMADISIKMWNMSSSMYNLTTKWKKLVAKNILESGDTIQLWSFRVNSRLHLVLDVVEKKKKDTAATALEVEDTATTQ